jgi:hypothetical protein
MWGDRDLSPLQGLAASATAETYTSIGGELAMGKHRLHDELEFTDDVMGLYPHPAIASALTQKTPLSLAADTPDHRRRIQHQTRGGLSQTFSRFQGRGRSVTI